MGDTNIKLPLPDLDLSVESLRSHLGRLELTFDHPDNALARWGRVYRVSEDGRRVWLEYIGWGFLSELRGWRYA